MKLKFDVNNKSTFCAGQGTVAGYRPVATRRDQLTESVRLEIKRLMLHHGDMQQVELVRRSGETKQRIQRFISGQMPYPPMDFLDKLFRVFGVTLIDGLKAAVRPVTQLPILRSDVQTLADTCSALAPEGVAAVQHLASTLRDGVRKGTAHGSNASARRHRKSRTSDKPRILRR